MAQRNEVGTDYYSFDPVIFRRVVRESSDAMFWKDVVCTDEAYDCLQCAAEEHLSQLYQLAHLNAVHAGRVCLNGIDLELVLGDLFSHFSDELSKEKEVLIFPFTLSQPRKRKNYVNISFCLFDWYRLPSAPLSVQKMSSALSLYSHKILLQGAGNSEDRRKHRLCPGGHELKLFEIPCSAYTCDLCGNKILKGAKVQCCRAYDHDVCQACLTKTEVGLP
jgi:histone H3/H4